MNTMKPIRFLGLLGSGLLGAGALLAADVRQGLVSYWPLNTYDAGTYTTPDVVSGNHFNAIYHSATDVVAGKVGNAFSFNPDFTQFLEFTNPEGADTGLPVGMSVKWTVMFWVNASYPVTGELDRRVYSESSSVNNDPLVNIGTDNDADTDGGDATVDLFIRNSGTQLNHVHGTRPAYDGQWHHVALVDSGGRLTLYVDGEVDSITPINYTPGPVARDVTAIGAIVRGAGSNLAAYFRGQVDEVAVWERDLTQDEVRGIVASGIQTPVPAFAPFITRDPAGASNLLVGDAYTLRASGGGTRPLTYQWLKDDAPVAGATAPTLPLTGMQESDSGTYKLRVTNSAGNVVSAAATLVVGDASAPNLTNSVVAYWPLNEAQGTKTPDIASGFDLDLVNLTAADVKPGKWGNAFTFDLARQTMLTRVHTAGEALPIYQYPDFSVSLWVNGPVQSDKRVFSEGSTKTTQPLFNIGTHNTGVDGTVDSYIRTDTGATSGDHRHSTAIAFDDTWHHIAYVQREVGGVMQAVMYIDGVKDDIVLGPVRPLSVDTTTVGGILRATPAAWFTGLIDDVVLWNRALSEAEVQQLATAVMPTPPAKIQPLAVNGFKADLPAVALGDSVTLRWDVSKSATEITIDPGVGNVTGQTVAGVGSRTVTPDKTTTYTLTIKRGAETLTTTTTVTVIDGVSANWTLLDNFDRYNTGPLSSTGWWRDLRGDFAQVEDQGGNRMLSIRSTDSAALLALGSLKIPEGQQRTLFFRMMPLGEPTAALQHLVGLTDQNIRWYGDADDNIGPILYLNHDTTAVDWFPGARNGVGGAIEYATEPLDTNAVYAVWIDIKNVPMNDPASPYDVYSVYLQKEGAAGRTELFKDYLSDRDPVAQDPVLGGMAPDLDKLFLAGNNTTDSAWFDDFYISDTGYNTTVPRAFGYSQPVGGETLVPTVGISLTGGQISVVWEGSALESASAVGGPWTPVVGAAKPYTTTPAGSAQFYRAKQ
jgi:hypothetical protein